MTQGVIRGQPLSNAVSSSEHAAIDHTGLPGVGDLTTAAHASLNHAGIPGVGDLTTAAHAVLNHSAIPGVGDLTTAAHSSLDHTGIPGVSAASGAIGIATATAGSTIVVPANTITTTGSYLRFVLLSTSYPGGGGNSVSVSFGGSSIYSSGLTSGGGSFLIEVDAIFLGGSSWQVVAKARGTVTTPESYTTITVNPASNQNFTFSVTAGTFALAQAYAHR